MIAAIALTVAVCAVVIAFGAARGMASVGGAMRAHFERTAQDRREAEAAAQVERMELVASFADERQRWEAERSILLTRIQDPQAAVAMTVATLPPPGEHDMDIR